jgi:hypothetical protein
MAEVLFSTPPDPDGYVTHYLDEPYYGPAHNGEASIRLNGQTRFQLAGTGDVLFEEPPAPPAPAQLPA